MMSIYFQYPSIDDYPAFVQDTKSLDEDLANTNDEYNTKMQELTELKDFLALKPV